MCFIRKSMDWYFTQNELKWIDSIMPESNKERNEEEQVRTENVSTINRIPIHSAIGKL